MKVTFWGVRGSLPASIRSNQIQDKLHEVLKRAQGKSLTSDQEITDFIQKDSLPFWSTHSFGSNTPCVQIEASEDTYVFCDAGTGIRDFAHQYMDSPQASQPATFHFFLSHLHWDHIIGFPFFAPAFKPGNTIIIHSFHQRTEEAFRTLFSEPFFPIPFDALAADVQFITHDPDTPFEVDGFKISAMQQTHPGTSYAYRFEKNNIYVVFATDCEHKSDALWEGYPFHDFFRDADLLIFDGQYTMIEATSSKEDWGHSSNMMGVELAAWSRAKHLVIFHLEHTSTDKELYDFLEATIKYRELNFHQKDGNTCPEQISLAYDGMTVDL